MSEYETYLATRAQASESKGLELKFAPDAMFDFQHSLTEWALRKGRAAMFADCGLGKTLMQLTWGQNVVEQTNKPVLVLTPLAVAHQTVIEGEKFGVEVVRSNDGRFPAGARIVVTNYERLHFFNRDDFSGVVLDESSILKNMDGVRRKEITEFMRTTPYRLLCTATAAPNDYTELGTSSEALGQLGHTDMLTRFFKSESESIRPFIFAARGERSTQGVWRFKGHAELPFWRWVTSWARALRKPSDIGFSDDGFELPPLIQEEHIVAAPPPEGMLFAQAAKGLADQRRERSRTMVERCEKAAELVSDDQPALSWCHLNSEGDLLTKLIPGAVQVSGKDSDEAKEEKFLSFINGESRVLVTKPSIGALGLNFQHCAHVTFFPSHSYEQTYQGIRRCWRFGQKRPVKVDVVTSEGEAGVLSNLQRKASQADKMFENLVREMSNEQALNTKREFGKETEVPSWL